MTGWRLPHDIPSVTDYRLIRKIATGGMGTVYEAEQYGTEGFVKKMALKIILPKYTDNHEFVDMFIGEAKLVANLVHPNIVQIYQLGRHDGGYFIAMEYIDGTNLEQFLLRHATLGVPVPLDIATFIVSRICRGLEYAHNKHDDKGHILGIVHRDVSPKNIMITSEGEVKLTDFGIAKALHYMEQEEGEVLMGKVEYMSPEQASYQKTDSRSDLFSLGIVYNELLTGKNIFECEDVFDTIDKVREGEIPDPRDTRLEVPEDVAKIVMSALTRDLNERYQTAGQMSYDLEYQMYSKGYGPTIVTLAKYMAEIFPDGPYHAPFEREIASDSEAMRGTTRLVF